MWSCLRERDRLGRTPWRPADENLRLQYFLNRSNLKNANSRRLWFFNRGRMALEQPVTRICAAK